MMRTTLMGIDSKPEIMTSFLSDSPSRRQFIETSFAVGLATTVAGCGNGDSGGDGTPTPESISIERIRFSAERPTGYREYEPVQDETYALGEAVWVYFEPEGVARESVGAGTERIELRIDATFVDAAGAVQDSEVETIDQELAEGQSIDELYLWVGTGIPNDAPPGTWEVEITLTDEVSGQSTTASRDFEVAGGGGQTTYLDAFGSTIQSGTDVRVRSLAVRDSTVALVYESTHESRNSEWEGEIVFIAGVYAGVVSQGWQAERLSVRTTGSEGTTVTWHVDRADAVAFTNDELSNEEFAVRVLETVEEQ